MMGGASGNSSCCDSYSGGGRIVGRRGGASVKSSGGESSSGGGRNIGTMVGTSGNASGGEFCSGGGNVIGTNGGAGGGNCCSDDVRILELAAVPVVVSSQKNSTLKVYDDLGPVLQGLH
ncbi:hypothetical protein ACOSP7_021664 [Xanthoceras sorbifolium]